MSNASEAPKRIWAWTRKTTITDGNSTTLGEERKWAVDLPITSIRKVLGAKEYILASHADSIKAAVAGMPDLVWEENPDRGEGGWFAHGLGDFVYHVDTDGWTPHRQMTWRDSYTQGRARAAANLHHREQLAKTLKGE